MYISMYISAIAPLEVLIRQKQESKLASCSSTPAGWDIRKKFAVGTGKAGIAVAAVDIAVEDNHHQDQVVGENIPYNQRQEGAAAPRTC